MYGCKPRLIPLAALAAAAFVAGEVREPLFASESSFDSEGVAPVVEEVEQEGGALVDGAEVAGFREDVTVPVPVLQSSPEEVAAEDSPANPSKPSSKQTIPIVRSDGQVVGEMQMPQLDRTKRQLKGLKTLMVSALAFFYMLAVKPTTEITTGEKVALTAAVVALGQYLYSLFSVRPKYEYAVVINKQKNGKQRAELEEPGLAFFQDTFLSKLKGLSAPAAAFIPTFFLVSGFIATLGYATTVSLTFSFILTILSVLGALSTGMGEKLTELFKQF